MKKNIFAIIVTIWIGLLSLLWIGSLVFATLNPSVAQSRNHQLYRDFSYSLEMCAKDASK